MYAVIKTGGKQHRVEAGDVIEVEFVKKLDPGATIDLTPILIVDDGKPHAGKGLAKAKVVARLLGEKKGDKIKVFKYRPKSGYARTQGHRQLMTQLEIQEIVLGPGKVAKKPEEPTEEPAAKKSAAKKATSKKPTAKKATAKKTTAKKTTAKKTTAKKTTAKKTTAKKTTAKKTTAKKTTARKKPKA